MLLGTWATASGSSTGCSTAGWPPYCRCLSRRSSSKRSRIASKSSAARMRLIGSSSCEMRHDLGGHQLVRLQIVAVVAVDQQIDADVAVSADQLDRLGHGADKAAQRAPCRQALALCRDAGRIAGQQPAGVVGLFDRAEIAPGRIAVAAEHVELVLHGFDVAADIAEIAEPRHRAQGQLLAAA